VPPSVQSTHAAITKRGEKFSQTADDQGDKNDCRSQRQSGRRTD
jgi:hypothetical protein